MTIISNDRPLLGYPQGYKQLQALFRKKVWSKEIGFHPQPGRLPIFANRLRVARQFRGFELEGYEERTETGYEGLTRVFLTVTAFEKLSKVLLKPGTLKSIDLYDLIDHCQRHDQTALRQRHAECDPELKFLTHVTKHLTGKQLMRALTAFPETDNPNMIFLALGMRHLFAHGHLTPSPNDSEAERIGQFCSELSQYLIGVMDVEFSSVIMKYCEVNGLDYDTLGES